MDKSETISQVEANKAVIQRYFEAYNNKNEAIFDEIIHQNCVDHGQSAYMGAPRKGIEGEKNDLRNSLKKLDELKYTIEELTASTSYPDLVGASWKGSLTPKISSEGSDTHQTRKKINYRGVSIYRVRSGKMVETWHVIDGLTA